VCRAFKRRRAPKQSGPKDKGTDEIWPELCQRLYCERQRAPQASRVFSGDDPGRPSRFDVASEQFQDLAEGEIGIADAGVRIAVSSGDDQVSVQILAAPGKLLHQRRLPAARFAGHEHDPTLAGQRLVEKPIQLRQLTLPGDEDRYFNFRRFSFEKRRQLGPEIRRGSRG
jgi:hypothetical protein